MDMSERGDAILGIIFILLIYGPVYFVCLLSGWAMRNKLIVNRFAKWVFIVSLPLSLTFAGLVTIYGTKQINTSSPTGDTLFKLSNAAILLGILALLLIVVQSLAASLRNNRSK